MAISIDYSTLVIYVPKADLTLVDAGPPEIRELDLDAFRLELKDLEDDVDGMAFLDTHRHVTETTIAGITLARVIEIINGYTVEFEDGQYTVNAVGANSNLRDVRVPNQVSLNTANSAGLIVYESGTSGLTPEESALLTSIGDRLPAALSGGKMDSALSTSEREAVANALLDLADGIESNKTLRQGVRIMLAVLAGKSSGFDAGTPKFRDTNDTKDRVDSVLDANGNRTAVTLDDS